MFNYVTFPAPITAGYPFHLPNRSSTIDVLNVNCATNLYLPNVMFNLVFKFSGSELPKIEFGKTITRQEITHQKRKYFFRKSDSTLINREIFTPIFKINGIDLYDYLKANSDVAGVNEFLRFYKLRPKLVIVNYHRVMKLIYQRTN